MSTRRISCLTSSRRLSPRRGRLVTAVTISIGGRHADVGHQQDLFERFRGVDIDVAGARLRDRRAGRCRRTCRDVSVAAWSAAAPVSACQESHCVSSVSPVSAAGPSSRGWRLADLAPAALPTSRWRSAARCRARAERQRRLGGLHAFGDHLGARKNLLQRLAARQRDPDLPVAAEIAGARQHQIAEPREARTAFRVVRPGRPPAARAPRDRA